MAMDTRQVGHAIRRRVGAPANVYGSGERLDADRGEGTVEQSEGRVAPEGDTVPMTSMPTLRGGGLGEERLAPTTMVHRSIPMGTDYEAIENAFDQRRVIADINDRDAHDGGMD